ncbi:MAG: hypothetical protein KJP15_00105 [Gammaproteobacteria bacterium]|nr:hypothetical protein [Gammaproteobacteria bacterium]
MRKFKTSTLGAMLVIAVIASTADAANFTDISFGISIDVDDALSKQPQLRDIQYFKSQDRSASLMIKRIHDLSIVEFVEELRNVGYRNMRDHVMLRLAGEPIEADIESGRGLLIPVTGQIRGHPTRGLVGAYSGHDGQGFLVIGTAKPQYWAAWNPRMKTMLDSVRFVAVDREAMAREWENWLMGKKLQYKRASVPGRAAGGPVQPDYHLCSDGTVMRKPRPAGRAAGQNMPVYSPGMNQSRGTWYVIVSKGQPYLIVRDGREQKLMLEPEGNNLLLNGKRYISAANDLCK